MSNLKQSAARAAAFRTLLSMAKHWSSEADADLLCDMADAGATQTKAILPDGSPAATISFIAGQPHPEVVNTEIALEWLSINVPDAIETVTIPERTETHIRPEFLAGLACVNSHCVTPSGEVVMGVAPKSKSPYLSVRDLKADAIIAALKRGSIEGVPMLMLPEVTSE
jgi:hypothetical protein